MIVRNGGQLVGNTIVGFNSTAARRFFPVFYRWSLIQTRCKSRFPQRHTRKTYILPPDTVCSSRPFGPGSRSSSVPKRRPPPGISVKRQRLAEIDKIRRLDKTLAHLGEDEKADEIRKIQNLDDNLKHILGKVQGEIRGDGEWDWEGIEGLRSGLEKLGLEGKEWEDIKQGEKGREVAPFVARSLKGLKGLVGKATEIEGSPEELSRIGKGRMSDWDKEEIETAVEEGELVIEDEKAYTGIQGSGLQRAQNWREQNWSIFRSESEGTKEKKPSAILNQKPVSPEKFKNLSRLIFPNHTANAASSDDSEPSGWEKAYNFSQPSPRMNGVGFGRALKDAGVPRLRISDIGGLENLGASPYCQKSTEWSLLRAATDKLTQDTAESSSRTMLPTSDQSSSTTDGSSPEVPTAPPIRKVGIWKWDTTSESYTWRLETPSTEPETPVLSQTPPEPSTDNEDLRNSFRHLMRSLPHAVTIITTCAPPSLRKPNWTLRRGMAISSLTSLSLSPEPLITFNIKTPSHTLDALAETRHFLVHVLKLSESAQKLAEAFTKGHERSPFGENGIKLKNVMVGSHFPVGGYEGMAKLPLLEGSGIMQVMQCEVLKPGEQNMGEKGGMIEIGDHVLVIARVKHVLEPKTATQIEKPALGYVLGAFTQVPEERKPEAMWIEEEPFPYHDPLPSTIPVPVPVFEGGRSAVRDVNEVVNSEKPHEWLLKPFGVTARAKARMKARDRVYQRDRVEALRSMLGGMDDLDIGEAERRTRELDDVEMGSGVVEDVNMSSQVVENGLGPIGAVEARGEQEETSLQNPNSAESESILRQETEETTSTQQPHATEPEIFIPTTENLENTTYETSKTSNSSLEKPTIDPSKVETDETGEQVVKKKRRGKKERTLEKPKNNNTKKEEFDKKTWCTPSKSEISFQQPANLEPEISLPTPKDTEVPQIPKLENSNTFSPSSTVPSTPNFLPVAAAAEREVEEVEEIPSTTKKQKRKLKEKGEIFVTKSNIELAKIIGKIWPDESLAKEIEGGEEVEEGEEEVIEETDEVKKSKKEKERAKKEKKIIKEKEIKKRERPKKVKEGEDDASAKSDTGSVRNETVDDGSDAWEKSGSMAVVAKEKKEKEAERMNLIQKIKS